MIIQKRIAKEAISRQKRMKFFGDANEESNKGLTVIGSLTYIQYLDEEKNFEQKKPLSTFKVNSSKGAYKPSKERVDSIDLLTQGSDTREFKQSGYVPANIKQFVEENENNEPISIILRNFPTDVEQYQLKDAFTNHFKSYGNIKNITILKDTFNNIKDIAFMEFYDNKDAIKVFEKPRRFIINKQIVSIERNKKKRKKR
tara:strand:- start:279 stop:878 length:600 start_codon:yes stop_codon:yes gene_type:complete